MTRASPGSTLSRGGRPREQTSPAPRLLPPRERWPSPSSSPGALGREGAAGERTNVAAVGFRAAAEGGPMKSFRERNPYAIGLVSVLAIGAFVGVAFMVGVLHLLEHTYPAKAVFNDAAGIRSGAFVRVAGIKAGRVTGVKPDRQQGKVVI